MEGQSDHFESFFGSPVVDIKGLPPGYTCRDCGGFGSIYKRQIIQSLLVVDIKGLPPGYTCHDCDGFGSIYKRRIPPSGFFLLIEFLAMGEYTELSITLVNRTN